MLSTCQHATIVFISALLPLAGSFSTGSPRVPTAHHARIAAPQLCQPQNSPWDEINRFATSAFKHVEETLQPQFPPPEPASEAVPEPRSVARHAPVKAADTATIIDKPIEIEEAVAAVKPLLDETAPPPVTVSVTPVDVTLVTPVPAPVPAPAPAPAPAPVPEPQPERRSGPLLKVVGIGGGGCSTVSRLPHALGAHLGEGVELVMVNTDAQALERDAVTAVEAAAAAAASDSDSDGAFSAAAAEAAITSFQMGEAFLYGQGAGGRPAWGADAAEAEAGKLRAELEGADMVFLTAGMGGGTGSGAAPVVARIAKEAGCLTVAVVSSPFGFEGGARADVADGAIGALSAEVDVLVVMKNERLLTMLPPGLTVKQALHAADEIARQAIVGVASLVAANQLINVDMADVRSVMENAGPGLISLGRASGNGRANAAVEAALTSPLLDIKLERVRGCAYSVTGGAALTLHEVHAIGERIKTVLDDNAQVIFGATVDPTLEPDEIVVTLIATGFLPPPSPPQPIYDVYAYRPPQPLLSTTDETDALTRYEAYLDSRLSGADVEQKAEREALKEERAAQARASSAKVQAIKKAQAAQAGEQPSTAAGYPSREVQLQRIKAKHDRQAREQQRQSRAREQPPQTPPEGMGSTGAANFLPPRAHPPPPPPRRIKKGTGEWGI